MVGAARVRWSQSLPQPSATHRAAVEAVRARVDGVEGLEVVGAWVAGNGLAAVVPHARAAAARLVRTVGPRAPHLPASHPDDGREIVLTIRQESGRKCGPPPTRSDARNTVERRM